MISFKASHTDQIARLSFSPDAGLLALGLYRHGAEFRDPTSGDSVCTTVTPFYGGGHFWGGPNRRTLFVVRLGHGITPINPDDGEELPRLKGWTGNGPTCFTSDGRYAVNARDSYRPSELQCWKLAADDVTRVWSRPVPNTLFRYRTPHLFLPDDDHFVYTEMRGGWREGLTVVVASRTDATDVAEGDFPNQGVGYHGASPCGTWLALGAAYGPSIHVYRTDDLKAAPIRLLSKSRKHYTGLAFHPSGQYMAATSNDATVTFFDTQTFTEARAFTWKIGRLRSVAFSPDGALAAVGSDKGQVVVWDVDL